MLRVRSSNFHSSVFQISKRMSDNSCESHRASILNLDETGVNKQVVQSEVAYPVQRITFILDGVLVAIAQSLVAAGGEQLPKGLNTWCNWCNICLF